MSFLNALKQEVVLYHGLLEKEVTAGEKAVRRLLASLHADLSRVEQTGEVVELKFLEEIQTLIAKLGGKSEELDKLVAGIAARTAKPAEDPAAPAAPTAPPAPEAPPAAPPAPAPAAS